MQGAGREPKGADSWAFLGFQVQAPWRFPWLLAQNVQAAGFGVRLAAVLTSPRWIIQEPDGPQRP